MNLHTIKKNFNKAAPTYDQFDTLQTKVGENLISLIKQYGSQYSCILDLGCGTGKTTAKLAKTTEYQYFEVVDIADALLKIAEKNLDSLSITIKEADFRNLSPCFFNFNLLFANLALHWGSNFEQTISSINHLNHQEGLLAFTIPLAGTLAELEGLCSLQRFPPQQNIAAILKKYNWRLLSFQQKKYLFSFSQLREALYSIKKVGANTTVNPKPIFKMKPLLNQPITLTYEIGFFIAKKDAYEPSAIHYRY